MMCIFFRCAHKDFSYCVNDCSSFLLFLAMDFSFPVVHMCYGYFSCDPFFSSFNLCGFFLSLPLGLCPFLALIYGRYISVRDRDTFINKHEWDGGLTESSWAL